MKFLLLEGKGKRYGIFGLYQDDELVATFTNNPGPSVNLGKYIESQVITRAKGAEYEYQIETKVDNTVTAATDFAAKLTVQKPKAVKK